MAPVTPRPWVCERIRKAANMIPFNSAEFFREQNRKLKREQRYRVFRRLSRVAGEFPEALWQPPGAGQVPQRVTVWCSNDYLGMSQHPAVLAASAAALQRYGAGAGGTRNISGTHDLIAQLEAALAALHGKGGALVFSSGYVANDTTLATLGSSLPGCVIFSDAGNPPIDAGGRGAPAPPTPRVRAQRSARTGARARCRAAGHAEARSVRVAVFNGR
jgi:5-aminolevulinate synthase